MKDKNLVLQETDKIKLALYIYDYDFDDVVNSFTLSDLKLMYTRVYGYSCRSNMKKPDVVNSIRNYARSIKRAEAFNR
ncbi:hypothetical protein [Paraclostridium bifermentans]|uniref:hypothetical protein n=1 Tax=Paraclostridium bifermentans TaxID=1490 RepID=UPI00374E90FA